MGGNTSTLGPNQHDLNPHLFMSPSLTPFVSANASLPREGEAMSWQLIPVSPHMLGQFLNSHRYRNTEVLQSEQYIQVQVEEADEFILITRYHFPTQEHLNNFVTLLLSVKGHDSVKLYTEVNQYAGADSFHVDMELKHNGHRLCSKLDSLDIQKKLLILVLCCNFLNDHPQLRIQPQSIIVEDGRCFITTILQDAEFTVKGVHCLTLWLFSPNKTTPAQLNSMNMQALKEALKQIQLPAILRAVLNMYGDQEVRLEQVAEYLEGISQRSLHTAFRMDSFHACLNYRTLELYQSSQEWIFFKRENNVFFFNTKDQHGHITTLIRKRNKILLDDVSVIFDEVQYELIFARKNTKHLVRANEFQLQNHASISDITLYQKLPFRLETGKLFSIGSEVLILEKNLYKMDTTTKTVREVLKNVSREVFVGITNQKNEPFVIKQSKDFLKDGIRVIGKDLDLNLQLAVVESSLHLLNEVSLDLQTVDFCLEIFSGVFVMMACRSLWILDFNLRAFFSYPSILQVRNYQQNRVTNPCVYNYMFAIKNQPFVAEFVGQQATHSVIRNQILFVLGFRNEQPVCLQYKFQPFTGSLVLDTFVSLAYDSLPLQVLPARVVAEQTCEFSKHEFIVQKDEMFLYKYQDWRLSGKCFLEIRDIKIQIREGGYQFQILSQKIELSLMDELRNRISTGHTLSRRETLLLVSRVLQIFASLSLTNTCHRGFSLKSLFFTCKKQLKLRSWTEPPRLQYVSDFKDLFLVIFNVITNSEHESLTSTVVEMYKKKLQEYSDIHRMMIKSVKLAVTQERKEDIKKTVTQLREFVDVEFLKQVESKVTAPYVFRFVPDSPMFLAMQPYEKKLIKLVLQQNDHAECCFTNDSQSVWSQAFSVLYVLTPEKLFSIKIDFDLLQDKPELRVKAQTEEFLPRKLSKTTLCLLPSRNLLYSFGGIETTINEDALASSAICVFSLIKLCWEEKEPLCCSMVGGTAVHSGDEKTIYLFGGVSSEYNMETPALKVIIYDTVKGTSQLYVDLYHSSPYQNCLSPPLVLLFVSDAGKQMFAFYQNNHKSHQVTLVELNTGGMLLEFQIQEGRNHGLQENKAQSQRQSKKGRSVKFQEQKHSPDIKTDWAPKLPQQINISAKDKSIYLFDSQNRLLVISFKSSSQATLDVFNLG